MDFQSVVDHIGVAACVVSVEKLKDGGIGKFRIVCGNRAYTDSIERPMNGVEMLKRKFVPNSDYTDYMTRDMNFEDSCYQAAVLKKCLHAYVHPDRYNVWFDLSFLPLTPDEGDLCYCLYIMEFSIRPNAKRMSTISSDIATAVLETCIKLRSPDDLKKTMHEVCDDIRELCGSEHCCIFLMDTEKRTCSVLAEAFSKDTDLISMKNYVDDKFYDIADSWKDTILGSNCIIAKNEHDWAIVKERNPVWYDSISKAGGRSIVLFPLEFKGELLGYIWAINFNADAADTIKETIELTSFVLASEIYSYRSIERLHVLSSRDMLTGVMNRNEMNSHVDSLADRTDHRTAGVVFVDLNGLKVVNDSKGHTAGDSLLRNAATVLKTVFSPNEIFRAGGDEFVVISTDITEDELAVRAEQIIKISKEYDNLVFAVGTAFADDTADIRTALRIADERMYEDKRRYYELHPEKKRSTSAV